MSLLELSLIVVGVLFSVSFYTLFERQALSSCHLRVGPQLSGVAGLTQAFSDAIKLLCKGTLVPGKANPSVYLACPVLLLLLSLVSWGLIPHVGVLFTCPFLVLIVFLLSSMHGFLHLMLAWGSNSSYALVGGLRTVAQSVSYEVSMMVLFVCVVVGHLGFNLGLVGSYSPPLVLPLLPLAVLWLITLLAECNRSPFDFGEAESELVSGFNLEYGGILFVLLFISEYCGMLFQGVLFSVLFLGGPGPLVPILPALLLVGALVWVRGSYPRTRYDKLMGFCWGVVLPIGLASGAVMSLSVL